MAHQSSTKKVSDKEKSRRLGRIYDMAVRAYQRAHPDPRQSQASTQSEDQKEIDKRSE